MGRRKQKTGIGLAFVVLGLGLLLAFTVPPKFLVVVLSIALAVSGIALCKFC